MSIVRDIAFTLQALEDTILVTCSALMSTAGSTSAKGLLSAQTTADAIVATAETTAFGRIIDRTQMPLGAWYQVAAISACVHSTRGSTEADRKLTIGVKLQHGDSSGGGDMADYSTESQPDTRQYFSSARSTDHASWDAALSTGEVYGMSNPSYYDLRSAKRYLRVGVPVFKSKQTTESSGDEQARVSATITFLGADRLPQNADTSSPWSNSTTT